MSAVTAASSSPLAVRAWRVGPVKVAEGDAVVGDLRVVLGSLKLACGLLERRAAGLNAWIGHLRSVPSRRRSTRLGAADPACLRAGLAAGGPEFRPGPAAQGGLGPWRRHRHRVLLRGGSGHRYRQILGWGVAGLGGPFICAPGLNQGSDSPEMS